MLTPLKLVWDRVEAARGDSPIAVCRNLMVFGEALLKTVTAGMIAAVDDDKDRHRYSLCHRLIRANGLGEWDDVLANVVSGPALQHLRPGALEAQQEFTARHGKSSYLHDATILLQGCLERVMPGAEKVPSKIEGRLWYSKFAALRNKERAHGATTDEVLREIAPDLEKSLRLVADNTTVLKRPWAFLRRNLSGKYNVVPLGDQSSTFERLKGDRSSSLADGVYVDYGCACFVELIDSTVDIVEFQYPNGGFRVTASEWISYISGARRAVGATTYLIPASALPPSETQGYKDLRLIGGCLANLPPKTSDYVKRDELETDLRTALMNDRHPVVTLVGRGGIGKTSLALEVLHQVADEVGAASDRRFLIMVWLSARDIDLLPDGPKIVRPGVLSIGDIAKQVSSLLEPWGLVDPALGSEAIVAQLLHHSEQGPILFVFDNFETVRQPVDVYNWIDTNVRSPNKVLITTRHSDFRGDYEVEVLGMTEGQCHALTDTAATAIGMRAFVTPEFRRAVYHESEGHPYVVKVLVGEAAEQNGFSRVERIVATRDDILNALFERTYARLPPAARRVFLTLGNWKSLVPVVALQAALLRPCNEDRIDVRAAIEELRKVSFIDSYYESAKDRPAFVSVPLAASEFCRKKLLTADGRLQIEDDTRFLHRFGAMQPVDLKHGLAPRVKRFFAAVSDSLTRKTSEFEEEYPILELIARQHPPAWLLLAHLIEEAGADQSGERTLEVLNRYLETGPVDDEQRKTWELIARIYRRRGDWLGYIDSTVRIAELRDADIITVSGAANTLNSVKTELGPTQKRDFVRRLIAAMGQKLIDGDATDCSRLAWLYLQDGNKRQARETVQVGLRLDPENEFCLNLMRKVE